MGREAECTAHVKGKSSRGKLHLETDELLFRGTYRLAVPLTQISSARARDGTLVVRFPGGTAEFSLGPRAERWAEAIRAPKPLIDKLGIVSGAAAAVLGINDPGFVAQLQEKDVIVSRRLKKNLDAVFFGAAKREDLKRLTSLAGYIKSDGAIWVVNPKGIDAIREGDVLAAGRPAGLVDVKVVRFSDTHTAHKFVIPRANRRK